jgi:hypothetical protein
MTEGKSALSDHKVTRTTDMAQKKLKYGEQHSSRQTIPTAVIWLRICCGDEDSLFTYDG